jgi:HEPN domain-containing protein
MSESDFEDLAETAQNSVLYKEIEEMMNAQNQFDDEYYDDEYFDDEYYDDEYYDDEYYF